MMERLEKFRAPPSWHHYLPGGFILSLVLVACNLDMKSAVTNDKIVAEKSAQAGAAERDRVLPFAHPLGCPEEAPDGRKLLATVAILGEKIPRCYYGPTK